MLLRALLYRAMLAFTEDNISQQCTCRSVGRTWELLAAILEVLDLDSD